MRFHATCSRADDGEFVASCDEQPIVTGRGLSPACALDRLREELRYRIELCPCSSVDEDYIELEARFG